MIAVVIKIVKVDYRNYRRREVELGWLYQEQFCPGIGKFIGEECTIKTLLLNKNFRKFCFASCFSYRSRLCVEWIHVKDLAAR